MNLLNETDPNAAIFEYVQLQCNLCYLPLVSSCDLLDLILISTFFIFFTEIEMG